MPIVFVQTWVGVLSALYWRFRDICYSELLLLGLTGTELRRSVSGQRQLFPCASSVLVFVKELGSRFSDTSQTCGMPIFLCGC